MEKKKDLHQIDLITGKTFLDSWKEISTYLERSEKTCRKWEKELNLPIHRLEDSPKARVFAYREELDAWMKEKLSVIGEEESGKPVILRTGKYLSRKWSIIISATLSFIFIIILNSNIHFYTEKGENISGRSRTIAVLPVENINGEPKIDCFADGMTDAVITELAKIKNLKVISRTSVMVYKNVQKPLSKIAKELNVDCIIEGAIYCENESMRISVQLIDANKDHHLWADTYERKFENVINIQKNIALDIAKQISVNVTPEEIGRISGSQTINIKAYDHFLRGCIEFDKTSLESLYSAISHFKRAIKVEPQFARAYAWIGISHFILAQMDTIPPKENFIEANKYADISLSIDEKCAEAVAVRAIFKWGYEWDFKGSEKLFKNAIMLSPSSSIIHNLYRTHLYSMGKGKETSEEIMLSRELDPNSLWSRILAIWSSKEDLDSKIRKLEIFIGKYPNDWRATGLLAGFYLTAGKKDKAIAMCERDVDIRSNHFEPIAWMAVKFAQAGDRENSVRILNDLLERDKNGYVSPTRIAEIYSSIEDNDNAFKFLNRALNERDHLLLTNILLWPHFENIRSDERYDELVKRMGLKRKK